MFTVIEFERTRPVLETLSLNAAWELCERINDEDHRDAILLHNGVRVPTVWEWWKGQELETFRSKLN